MGASLLIINFKKRQAITLAGSSSAHYDTMNGMFKMISELDWNIMDIKAINCEIVTEEEDHTYGQMKKNCWKSKYEDEDDTYDNEKVCTYEQFKIDY